MFKNEIKKMTTAEMLASLEAQIRKVTPRLMELREGCWIKQKTSEKDFILKVIAVKDDFLKCVLGFADFIFLAKDIVNSPKSFEIIGHDIMLNDVLEWLRNCKRKIIFDYKTGYFLDEFDYYYSFSSNYHENAPTENKIWNLSSPYLKDQSKELIKFLYNSIK